jgi:guanylate kinase
MGKSSSGKDTLYGRIVNELGLIPVVLYTTRPVRDNEREGVEYHFVDDAAFERMKENGTVIEYRIYDTVYGKWTYFTAADSISLDKGDCIGIGTLESYEKIRRHYGDKVVVPLYIEVDDNIRFLRAVEREKKQSMPKFLELCRRFVADSSDFSEEKLEKAGITFRFDNSSTPDECFSEIKKYISEIKEK